MTRTSLAAAVLLAVALAPPNAAAQSTGSPGCAAFTQASANGASVRVEADDVLIRAPSSVTNLSCLDNFFNGVGLNLITDLLDPTSLLETVRGRICALVQNQWNAWVGSVQCGLTVSGINIGFFGGLGGGLSCPRLSFGGGGPPIATIGAGANLNGQGVYINGTPRRPTGFPPILNRPGNM